MKAYIILGNTREKSNTKALAGVFADELSKKGAEVETVSLLGKSINTCVGCDKCHVVTDSFGCAVKDDMHLIATGILAADLVVLASPIYTWMPTPGLKAVMDRIYAFTKYPETGEAFNMLKKQKFAMIATSGDKCETNCDLFNEAVKRMADFAKLEYLGYVGACDFDGKNNDVTAEADKNARKFANKCMEKMS